MDNGTWHKELDVTLSVVMKVKREREDYWHFIEKFGGGFRQFGAKSSKFWCPVSTHLLKVLVQLY